MVGKLKKAIELNQSPFFYEIIKSCFLRAKSLINQFGLFSFVNLLLSGSR